MMQSLKRRKCTYMELFIRKFACAFKGWLFSALLRTVPSCDLLCICASSSASPATCLWLHINTIPFAHGQLGPARAFSWAWLTRNLLFLLSDIENASDIALYSGLGAAVIAVAVLVVGVTLYRRSQSEYGVDVIDSSALTGGFQTFNFKTVRQG